MKSEKVLLLAFAAFVFALVPERSGAQEIITNPWLQNVYTNRFTVMCETRGEIEGLSVQYGDDLVAPMTSTNGLKEGTFVYSAAIEGPTALPDGATIPYCLATNGVAIAGTKGSVKLWADGDAAFTCAIWGDNQEGVHEYDWGFDVTDERYRCVREMFKHMSAQKPDFGFTTGDVSSFADYDNEIEPGDLRAADDLFCKGQTPYHLIWGNHDCVGTFFGEVYTNAAQRYFAPAATEEDGWFHVYRNDVLFIGVHWTWGQEGQDERYERILKEVAELLETPRAKQAKFRILMQHAPVFLELYNVLPGIEWFDDSRTHDVAVKGGVDLIFSGHTHAYERIERDGMIQITNGGMGYLDHGERCYKNFGTDTKVGGHQNTPYLWARQNEEGTLAAAQPVRMGCFASYGMLKVEGDTLKYTAHAFDANGDYIGVADSFEIESKTRSEVKVGGEGEQRNVKPFTPTALTSPVNNATWKEFKTAQGEAWEIPAGQKGADPVVNVSKTEIARFCAALNEGQETNYRLPTVKELTEIFGGDLKREVSEWTSDVDPNTGWCRILGGNKKAVDGTWCRAYDKPAIATADCHANYLGFRVIDAADPIPEETVMDRALAALEKIENPAEVYQWSPLKGKLVDISDEWTKPTTLDKKTYGAPVIFTGKGPLVYRVRREVSFDGGLAAPNATALNIAHVLDLGPVSKPVTIKGEVRGGVSTNEWTFALRCDELTLNNVLYRGQALNVVTDSRALHLEGTNDFSGAVMTVCCDRKLPDPFKDCVTNLVTDSAATLKLRALHFSNRGVVEEVLVDKPAGLTVGENVTLVTAENVLFGIDGSTLTVNGALDAAGIDIEGHLMGLLPQEATLGGSGKVTTTHFGMCDVSTLYVDVTNTIVRSSIPCRTYTACTNGCNVVYRAPRQPNYADATGKDWLYNHAIEGKACPDEAVETGVDLFYVYPTIAGGEEIAINGFRDIDDATMRSSELSRSTAVGAFAETGRCFADMTHVYAPFYRQLTLGAAMDISTNAQGEVVADANARYVKTISQGPSYADVTNALTTYFAKWNNGRKLVLAGHSQGSAHLRLLMRDYFTRPENRDKAKQVICSYQVGYGMSAAEMADITEKTGITFASDATGTGVIVSYNTMGEDSSGSSTLLPPDTIAINPLTWTRSTELAEKDLNLGALTNALGTADIIVPGLYGAQVADTGFNRGEVVVCKELNGEVLPPSIFGTGSLHGYDYGAYWENLRANVYDRGGKLAGLCKLCTTNFPAHFCVSNTTINLVGKSAFDVDPVAGTVWIPTNGLESAQVLLVPEKGYRLLFEGQEYPYAIAKITLSNLQADGEFLVPSQIWSYLSVEWIQRKPDYADKTGKDWLFNHDIPAKRYALEPAADPGVDLFFLYPTSVYISDDHVVDGICDIDDPVLRGPNGATNAWVKSAEVFGDFTHVYAPYYRQTPSDVEIPIGAQPNANAEMRQYWYKRAPYEDVTNALTHYFTKINPDGKRPFIFAGHSHGSGILSLVMEHFFAEKGRKAWLKNMVACYAIGWGVSKDWEAKLNDDLDMYVATNATDAGAYIFWNTYGPNTNATECILYPDPAKSAACVNPLLWTRVATNATAELNLGGWTTDDPPRVLPHLYDASNHVANGTLICTSKDVESQYLPPLRMFGEHSLHGWDYKLYWENIRDNAYARIETATKRKPCCGTPTDYSASDNWLSRPAAEKGLDVFYLYPTCVSLDCPTLIGEIDDDMKANAQEEYERGPSTFESYANVYAPYYRQGSVLMIVADTSTAGTERFCSTHVVKTDVFAALDYYFTNVNVNAARPFILASHSQGSANMKNVLAEYFVDDKAAYANNLVAAYILGWKITPDWCEKVGVPFATGADDTRVVMTWNAEGPGEKSDNFITDDPTQLAINPINWKRDTTDAPKADNLGSVITNAQGVLYHTGKPGVTGARLQTNRPGALIVDAPETIPVGISPGFGTKSYHFEDFGFFHDNVGNNGFTRYAAFADLSEVRTNDVPKVADATWKVKVKGEGEQWTEAVVSPVDGKYYAPTAAQEVKLVYTLDPEKAAEGYRFANGETTMPFAMAYSGGVWVSTATKAEIEAATKVDKPDLKLGAVAQRYPWDGTVDVNYRAAFWPEGQKAAIVITVGETVVTNDLEIVGCGEIVGATNVNMRAIAPGVLENARFEVLVR